MTTTEHDYLVEYMNTDIDFNTCVLIMRKAIELRDTKRVLNSLSEAIGGSECEI